MIRKENWRNLIVNNFSFSQGIKIFRIHNVEEVKQGLLIFKTLLTNEKKIFWNRWDKGTVNIGNINGEKFSNLV